MCLREVLGDAVGHRQKSTRTGQRESETEIGILSAASAARRQDECGVNPGIAIEIASKRGDGVGHHEVGVGLAIASDPGTEIGTATVEMTDGKVAATPSSVVIEVPRQHAGPGVVTETGTEIEIEIESVIGIERGTVTVTVTVTVTMAVTVIGTGTGIEIAHQGETEIAVGNAALVSVVRTEA